MTEMIPFPFELETERLIIRSPSAADARELVEAVEETIDTLRPWMPWADHVPTFIEAQEACSHAEQAFKDGKDFRLHLFLNNPRVFIGGSGLHRIDWSVPKCKIGYWVRRSYSGKGYVTEAVKEITRFALEDLGAKRVEIQMSAKNSKSRRVPERLGFVLEGTLRNETRNVDGTLRDTCVYSKIKEVQHDAAGDALTARP